MQNCGVGDESPPATARALQPFSIAAGEMPVESWSGSPLLSWSTVVSADRQPSDELVAGVCTILPGHCAEPHRHSQAEIYFFLSGSGQVTAGDSTFEVSSGCTVFIPGGEWHHTINTGDAELRLFYCFAATSFGDIRYEFPDGRVWRASSDQPD